MELHFLDGDGEGKGSTFAFLSLEGEVASVLVLDDIAGDGHA